MNYLYRKLKRSLKESISLYRLKKYYTEKTPEIANEFQEIIYMCDGHRYHGGLGDRLSGLVSTYAYCKDYGLTFKVHWVHPYNLSEFLVPNKYDWTLSTENISYNITSSVPVLILYRDSVHVQRRLARKLLYGLKNKQIHVYTNMKYMFQVNYKYLFNELFKPSPFLQKAIDEQLNYLSSSYVSITFRFQQLLGDLKEGNFPVLTKKKEKENLINTCLNFVRYVRLKNPEVKTILVTSDSVSFLERVKIIDSVYVVPGKVVHVDFNKEPVDISVHLKSFLDLFLISKAKKIYNVSYSPLYTSGFPFLASLISGHEYIELTSYHINEVN